MKSLVDKHYWTYEDLIDSMEVEVVLEKHDNDYQGDSYYIVKQGSRYGYLNFGWGSCSGCDALEACGDVAEATALRDDLWHSIHWADSAGDLLVYFLSKDWDLTYQYHVEKFKGFLVEAISKLSVIAEEEKA